MHNNLSRFLVLKTPAEYAIFLNMIYVFYVKGWFKAY